LILEALPSSSLPVSEPSAFPFLISISPRSQVLAFLFLSVHPLSSQGQCFALNLALNQGIATESQFNQHISPLEKQGLGSNLKEGSCSWFTKEVYAKNNHNENQYH
jgi:hypothetical protein